MIKASDADTWVICPLSVTLQAQYPAETTPAKNEGIQAHAVLSGTTLDGTPDMFDGAVMWRDHIAGIRSAGAITGEHGEYQLTVPRIHQQAIARPDYVMYGPGVLHVLDYKYGHREVPADSWQNKMAVAGLLGDADDREITVHMHVVQPRNFHGSGRVRTVTVNASDLRADINLLATQATRATQPNPPGQTGPQCLGCSARHACPLAQQAGYAAIEYAGSAVPLDLDPVSLGHELTALDRAEQQIRARRSGLAAAAESMLAAGQTVSGWALEQSTGRLTWSRPIADVLAIGDAMGVDLRKLDTVTPTQAKKLLPPELIDLYATRTAGAVKLVPSLTTAATAAFKRGK